MLEYGHLDPVLTRRCEALDQGMCQLTRSDEAHTHPDDDHTPDNT